MVRMRVVHPDDPSAAAIEPAFEGPELVRGNREPTPGLTGGSVEGSFHPHDIARRPVRLRNEREEEPTAFIGVGGTAMPLDLT